MRTIGIFCPWYPDGLMWPYGEKDSGIFRCTACGRCRSSWTEPGEWREPAPAAWWQGANYLEVLTFKLSSENPPDGSGVVRLTEDELRRQLQEADVLLRDRGTRWLDTYAARLVQENRRRRGAV